jgi:CHAT domain-containing protein
MNERVPHDAFPSDETLAAFIDGRLDPETRRRVVEHMATCAECYDVMLAVRGDQTSPRVMPFRRRSWTIIGLAAAAVIAIVALFTTPLREHILPQQKSGLAALANAAPPQRNIEGRLSGFPYQPLKPVTRGAEEDDTSPEHLKLLSVAAQVAADAKKNPTPDNLHAYGVSLLMLGKDEQAVAILERAVRNETGEADLLTAIRKSDDARLLTDLAAAYVARGDRTTHAADYMIAVEASDRAWRLAQTPDTAWNRAVAISKLHVGSDEVGAWRDYLALDPSSPWSTEAKAHLRPPGPTTWNLWPSNKEMIARGAAAGDAQSVARIVAAMPQQVRTYAEDELLVDWAHASKSGDERSGMRALTVARMIGNALESLNGDAFVADCVASIEHAAPDQKAAIANAIVEYADARRFYAVQEADRAIESLRHATSDLHAAGCPLAERSQALTATALFYVGRFDAALAMSHDALRVISADRRLRQHRSVIAQLEWSAGLAQLSRGCAYEALASYRAAVGEYDRLRESENAAFLRFLIAENLDYLGSAEAWDGFIDAARRLRASGSPTRLPVVYGNAARAALRDGYVAAALLFGDSALRAPTTEPSYRIDALRMQAESAARAGRSDEASRAVAAARALCAAIPDENIRSRAAADIAMASIVEPSVEELNSWIDFFRGRGDAYRLCRLLFLRGSVYARRNETARALADYDAAFDAYKVAPRDLADPERARGWTQLTRPFIDAAVSTALARGDAGTAFRWVERVRMQTTDGTDRVIGLGTLPKLLRDGDVVVEYWVTDTAAAAWIIDGEGARLVRLPMAKPVVRDLATTLRQVPADPAAFVRTAASAYDDLIRPLNLRLSSASRLIIVPDESMRSIPWCALFDGIRKRYLIQDTNVAVAPAASRIGDGPTNGWRVANPLFVADPSFDGVTFPDLPRLPGARSEASTIALMFPRSHELTAESATLSRVRALSANADVLHFAGHTLLNARRPQFSGLLLAPDGASNRSLLYAGDIDARTFGRVRLVVLAACESANGEADGDDFSPIGRAFLRAGVPFVVGTIRNVVDANSASLLVAFYRALAQDDPVIALGDAQRSMLLAAPDNLSWSAFEILIGNGSRREEKS